MSRKNIAIIGVGVVGIPVLKKILTELSSTVNVTVYSFIPVAATDVPPGVRVKALPRFHVRLQYILLGLWFIKDHLQKRYHIIHAQSVFPGGILARFLGKLFNIPWMVTLIGGETEAIPEIPFGNLLDAALRSPTIKVCREAHAITAMSEFQADSTRKNLRIEREIIVLPYAPQIVPLKEKSVSFPVRLLHIANHHPVKNHDGLLELASILLNKNFPFTLVIVGANYDEPFIEKVKQKKLQDNVMVVGARKYSEIPGYMDSAHILVHTSWYEGLPTVAFEAMGYGVPVCGTPVGILEDFSGQLCITADAIRMDDMADKIIALSNSPILYQELRLKAYAWASKNDADHYVKSILDLYNTLYLNAGRKSLVK